MKKKVVIECVGTKCNQDCVFCTVKNYREQGFAEKNFKRISKELKVMYEHGFRMVELIGGELTIRKDFLDIIREAKVIGFEDIGLSTNMKRFSDSTFTATAVKAGVNFVYMSLHGYDAKSHESATQARGSFDNAIEAIKNIVEYKAIYKSINCVIHSDNVEHLKDVCELILSLGVRDILFIIMDPLNVEKEKFNIVPRYDLIATNMREVLSVYGKKMNIRIQNLPYCLLEEGIDNFSKYDSDDSTVILLPNGKSIGLNEDSFDRKIKFQECLACKYNSQCNGYWRNYFKNRV